MVILSGSNPFFDQNILDLLNGIHDQISDLSFIDTAKEISAVLALLYLSLKAYAMIVGAGQLDILSLFRPFVITMCIVNFSLLTTILQYPGNSTGSTSKDNFIANAGQVDLDLDEKRSLNDKVFNMVILQTNQIKQTYYQSDVNADKTNDEYIWGFTELGSSIDSSLTLLEQLMWLKMGIWMQNFFTDIILSVFKGCAYFIFFLQMFLQVVLETLGPISFAFSIIGSFKDAWVTWASRYIAVSFYNTIGFIVLSIACGVIDYGLQQEIDRINMVIQNANFSDITSTASFFATVTDYHSFLGFLFIGLIIAIGGIFSVPVVSTWIIQSSGTGSTFIGTVTGAAKSVGRGAGKALSGATGL